MVETLETGSSKDFELADQQTAVRLLDESKYAESCTQKLDSACSGVLTKIKNAGSEIKKAADEVLLHDIEYAHFKYFVDQSDKTTGLTKDRSQADSASSIAAVGFSLTSYPIAVSRGWISRDQAADYSLKVLRTLWNAPQGEESSGQSGYKGFFYHFLDPKDGTRAWKSELSTIDTALLMAGVLFTKNYFDGDSKEEAEIRDLADKLYRRVDWNWALNSDNRLSMGWHPESGFIKYDWQGYNEAMILLLLGLGSPTHALPKETWQKYTETETLNNYGGQKYIDFRPHFGHQYSHAWVDFRGIYDDKTRALGFDYFENSRRATYAQNYYGTKNPLGFRGYSKLDWGWTACDGPGEKYNQGSPSSSPAVDNDTADKPAASDPESIKPESINPESINPESINPESINPESINPESINPESSSQGPDNNAADNNATDYNAADNSHANKGKVHFHSYIARGAPDSIDDGTIAPTAAAASIVFAPELVLPTLYHWRFNRPEIWSSNGFKDAFNPTADPTKPSGWVAEDTLGIDQGPIVLMTENYRSGMVWELMKKDSYLKNGLRRAGFQGGWLDKAP